MVATDRQSARTACIVLGLSCVVSLAACDASGGGGDGVVDGSEDLSLMDGTSMDSTAADTQQSDVAPDSGAPAPDVVVIGNPDASSDPGATDALFADDAPIHHFDIELAPEDLAFLDEDPTRETYVRGTVRFRDETYTHVGVRYKGAYGSLVSCVEPDGTLVCNKLSLKLSFNEYQSSGRFHGVRKVLLHACNRDLSCLRERMSYRIYRAAGIPTSRVVHATASINGELQGLYAMVEYIDKEFVEDHFERDEGNLYKEVWPGSSADPAYFLEGLRTNEAVGDVSRIVAFANALDGVDDASWPDATAEWLDADRQARYNALDQLVHNWDGVWKFYCLGGTCFNHNYYLYDDPATGRFVVVPWDLDHTFTHVNDDMARSWWDDSAGACDIKPITIPGVDLTIGTRAPQCDPLMRGTMRGDQWEAYRAHLEEIMAAPETRLEDVLARFDRYRDTIRPVIENDPSALPLAEWDAEVARLRDIIRDQYDTAQRFLDEPGPLP